METKANNLSSALGKFNNILIKNKFLEPESHKIPYLKLMEKEDHSISFQDSEKKSTLSSLEFVKGPLANMLSRHEKSKTKIEELKRQKNVEEISSMRKKPLINTRSKHITKTTTPIYKRTEKILKEKSVKLENQRNEKKESQDNEFSKTCTFAPRSRRSSNQSSRSRSPEMLTKELYKWHENKEKSLASKIREKQTKEILEIAEKPKIDNLSVRLSKNVKCI